MSVVSAIEELFLATGRVGSQARKGLMLDQLSRSTANKVKQLIPEIERLSEHDHAAIDEIVQFGYRLFDSYVTHHASGRRPDPDHEDDSIDLLNVTVDALRSRSRSHLYNLIAGRPADEQDRIFKSIATAGVREITSAINE